TSIGEPRNGSSAGSNRTLMSALERIVRFTPAAIANLSPQSSSSSDYCPAVGTPAPRKTNSLYLRAIDHLQDEGGPSYQLPISEAGHYDAHIDKRTEISCEGCDCLMSEPITVVLILVVTVLGSLLGLALVRRLAPPERLARHTDVAGYLYAVVGV